MENLDPQLYRQEVEELTELLRSDEDWDDLRQALSAKGFVVDDVLLVSFFEDDRDLEYGVLVTGDRKVYEYERSTTTDLKGEAPMIFSELTGSEEAKERFPQINIALAMLEE